MEHPLSFVETLLQGASELGLIIDERRLTQLSVYLGELMTWNKRINLTAIKEDKAVAVKHFLDSLVCAKVMTLSQSTRLLDVGSGAGFPGVPLKILHPEIDLTLLEPNQKKTAFLRHLIGTLGLHHAAVVPKRIQEFSLETAQQRRFAYVITRAVKPESILPTVHPLLQGQGRVILCRAESLKHEQSLCGLKVTQELSYRLPYGYGQRTLTILEETVAP